MSYSRDEVKAITVEDPVEYHVDGVNQIQAHPEVGLTFAAGLRSILRHDPDIIMIGEIRDRETAEAAVQASLTGHLVFSTLHTNDAAGAMTRLLDMSVEPFLVASSVEGVMAQRLVPGAAVTIEGRANEQGHLFGSVTGAQIGRALRDKGFPIEDRMVRLAQPLKEIGVFDVNGRLVRMLDRGVARSGRHSVEWDLRGEDGRPAGNGVYFLRFRLGAESASRKLVLMH